MTPCTSTYFRDFLLVFFYKAMLVKNKHSSVEGGMGRGIRKCKKKKNCREQLSLRPQLSWRRHVPVIFMA